MTEQELLTAAKEGIKVAVYNPDAKPDPHYCPTHEQSYISDVCLYCEVQS